MIGSDDSGNPVHPSMRVTNRRSRGIWLSIEIGSYFRRSPTLIWHYIFRIQGTVQQSRCVNTSGKRNNTQLLTRIKEKQ